MATYSTPSCIPTLVQLHSDPSFMARMAQASKAGNDTNVDMLQSGSDERVRLVAQCLPLCLPAGGALYACYSELGVTCHDPINFAQDWCARDDRGRRIMLACA